MIRSMTGYGRAQKEADGRIITVEIKTVNHRYYEYTSRLPRSCGALDEKLKNHLKQEIHRGKTDVFVRMEETEAEGVGIVINYALADRYMEALHTLADRYGIAGDMPARMLAGVPEVLTVTREEADEDALWAAVREVADEALDKLVAMRTREGETMRADILSRCDTVLDAVAFIEERSPQTVQEHMDKVTARMRELLDGAAVDEQRLLTEAALYADRIAVAEETVRLRSHIDQLRDLLNRSVPVGRDMDFLVQEMNREINTVGSKSQDVALARKVIEVKAEIEKIREQLQNIE